MKLLELMTARDVDSEMKKLGISKIPLSSKGERVLQGMVKEKFIGKVTNMERLIYFVESLGDKRWLYHTKGEPLSPLVNKFKGDIEGAEISFGAKLAAYHVAMNIKDREEVDSPYEMMKEYFKNFGMQRSGSKTFDMAVTNLEQWMKRNKMMKLTERRLRKLIREEIESMREFVNVDDYLKDGNYEFLHSYGLATLKYGDKVISKGGEDFDEAEDGYLMKHSSWRDEKVFDTARDVIDYFKKRRIKRK